MLILFLHILYYILAIIISTMEQSFIFNCDCHLFYFYIIADLTYIFDNLIKIHTIDRYTNYDVIFYE